VPHQAEDSCQGLHCFSHDEDEPGEPCYRLCGECFHVFPTAGDLVQDHNAEVQVMMARWGGNLLMAADVGEIFSCPWCAHDW
jgi:hypothetical protein